MSERQEKVFVPKRQLPRGLKKVVEQVLAARQGIKDIARAMVEGRKYRPQDVEALPYWMCPSDLRRMVYTWWPHGEVPEDRGSRVITNPGGTGNGYQRLVTDLSTWSEERIVAFETAVEFMGRTGSTALPKSVESQLAVETPSGFIAYLYHRVKEAKKEVKQAAQVEASESGAQAEVSVEGPIVKRKRKRPGKRERAARRAQADTTVERPRRKPKAETEGVDPDSVPKADPGTAQSSDLVSLVENAQEANSRGNGQPDA